MKVIQVPFCFYPDAIGGTEVYVESLAKQLQRRGIEVLVAAPREGDTNLAYSYNGVKVRRFSVSKDITDLYELYGEGNIQAANAFGKILDEEKPDMVHLHAFTRGVSLRLVREAKKRGIYVIFTYHTPTVSCQRGTLMRWGAEVCDGLLDVHDCARCTLRGLGISKASSLVVGSLPTAVGRLLGTAMLSGGIWTALRMTQLIELRHASFRALMNEVDHIIAVCQWVKDLLLRNDILTEKVIVSRQGLCQDIPNPMENHILPRSRHSPLRIAYLGRLDSTKGVDVLIQAARSLPKITIELNIYGIAQSEGDTAYLKKLKSLAQGDQRILFNSPVQSNQVVRLLKDFDLLAVPSQWLETGPLVVLEAFAAGIPVIGSNLGGIAELVEHNINGLLVKPDSVEAWREALQWIFEDRALLMRLRAGISAPRGMDTVALEMEALYHQICNLHNNRE